MKKYFKTRTRSSKIILAAIFCVIIIPLFLLTACNPDVKEPDDAETLDTVETVDGVDVVDEWIVGYEYEGNGDEHPKYARGEISIWGQAVIITLNIDVKNSVLDFMCAVQKNMIEPIGLSKYSYKIEDNILYINLLVDYYPYYSKRQELVEFTIEDERINGVNEVYLWNDFDGKHELIWPK